MPAAYNIVLQASLAKPNGRAFIDELQRQIRGTPILVDVRVSPESLRSLQNLNAVATASAPALRNLAAQATATGLASAQMGASMARVNASSGAMVTSVNSVAQSARVFSRDIVVAGTAAEAFGQRIGLTTRRLASLLVASSSIFAFVRAVRTGITEAVQFEQAMLKLSQISGGAMASVQGVANEIGRVSTKFGVSSKELADVSVQLRRAGVSADDVKTSLEALAKAAQSPSFESMAKTAEAAVVVFRQFGVQAKDLEGVLGSLDQVASHFAVSSGDITEGIKTAGASFKQAGGNLNELVALFASVRGATREASGDVASGLRTIFARVQQDSVIDDLKRLQVVLRYTKEEATAVGNTSLENQFVGPYEAVKRLSAALSGLKGTDPRFAEISSKLGGYREISKIIPLLSNFADAQKALNVAQAGSASLAANAAASQGTLLTKVTKLREEFELLIRSVADSKTFKAMADFFIHAASAAIKLADAVKPLLPLLAALGIGAIARSIGPALAGFQTRALGTRFATGGHVPGHGDTDSVPALLTPGEFVVTKRAAQQVGYGTLRRMNAMASRAKFAEGGEAQDVTSSPAPRTNEEIQAHMQKAAKKLSYKYKNNTRAKRFGDREDIEHEALAHMLEHQSKYDPSHENASGYFYSAGKNHLLKEREGDDVTVESLGDRDVASSSTSSDADSVSREERQRNNLLRIAIEKARATASTAKSVDLKKLSVSLGTHAAGRKAEVSNRVNTAIDFVAGRLPDGPMPVSQAAQTAAAAMASAKPLTVKALQAQLREKGLPIGGKKADLVKRLAGAPEASQTSAPTPVAAGSGGASKPPAPPVLPSPGDSSQDDANARRLNSMGGVYQKAEPLAGSIGTGSGPATAKEYLEATGPMYPPLTADSGRSPYSLQSSIPNPLGTEAYGNTSISGIPSPKLAETLAVAGQAASEDTSMHYGVQGPAPRLFQGAYGGSRNPIGGSGDDKLAAAAVERNRMGAKGVNPRLLAKLRSYRNDRPWQMDGETYPLLTEGRNLVPKNFDVDRPSLEGPQYRSDGTGRDVLSRQVKGGYDMKAAEFRLSQSLPDEEEIYGLKHKDDDNRVANKGGSRWGGPNANYPTMARVLSHASTVDEIAAKTYGVKDTFLNGTYGLDKTENGDFVGPLPTPDQLRRQKALSLLAKSGAREENLSDIFAQKAEAAVKAKGGANVLSRETKDSVLKKEEEHLHAEFIRVQARQIKALNSDVSSIEAEKIARNHLEDAIKGNQKVLVNAQGQILGRSDEAQLVAQLGKDPNKTAGGWMANLFGNAGKSRIGQNLIQGFKSIGSIGLMAGATYASSWLDSQAGGADTAARTGKTESYTQLKGASGALTGAITGGTSGFLTGSAFGPEGAAIGAAVGAVAGAAYGLYTSLQEAGKAIRESKLADSMVDLQTRIANVIGGQGTTAGISSQIKEDILQARVGSIIKAKESLGGSWNDSAENRAAAGEAGQAELAKNMGPQLASMTQLLEKEASSLGKSYVGRKNINYATEFSNGGAGANAAMLQVMADLEKLPVDKVIERFAKLASESQIAAEKEKAAADASGDVGRSLYVLDTMVRGVSSSLVATRPAQLQAQGVASRFGGGLSASNLPGISPFIQDIGNPNTKQFSAGVDMLTANLGDGGTDLADELRSANLVRSHLPTVLAKALGQSPLTGPAQRVNIADLLKQELGEAANTGAAKKFIASTASNVDFDTLPQDLKNNQGDLGALSDKLSSGYSSVGKSGESMAKDFDANAAEFLANLHKLSQQTLVVAQEMEKGYGLELQAIRARATITAERAHMESTPLAFINREELYAPYRKQQEYLADVNGPGAFDVGSLRARLHKANEDIPGLEAAADRARGVNDQGHSYNDAANALKQLEEKAYRLNQALVHLTDASRDAADQEKLQALDRERGARLSLADRVSTADSGELANLNRGLMVVQSALAGRNWMSSFSVDERKLGRDFLRAQGDAILPGLGNGQQTGSDIYNMLLRTNPQLSGIANQIPGKEGERHDAQERIAASAERAIEAQKAATEEQKNLAGSFFERLLGIQAAFFYQLQSAEKTRKLTEATSELGVESAQLGALKGRKQQADILAAAHITTDDQRKAIVSNESQIQEWLGARDAMNNTVSQLAHTKADVPSIINDVMGHSARQDGGFDLTAKGEASLAGRLKGLSPQDAATVVRQMSKKIDPSDSQVLENNDTNKKAAIDALQEAMQSLINSNIVSGQTKVDELRKNVRGPSDEAMTSIFGAAKPEDIIKAAKAFDDQSVKFHDVSINLGNAAASLNEAADEVAKLEEKIKSMKAGLEAPRDALSAAGTVASLASALNGPLGAAASLLPAEHHAAGGVAGLHPGRPRNSDNIPAWLSEGEFVVNAASTAANRGLLEHINKSRGASTMFEGGVAHLAGGGELPGFINPDNTNAQIEHQLAKLWPNSTRAGRMRDILEWRKPKHGGWQSQAKKEALLKQHLAAHITPQEEFQADKGGNRALNFAGDEAADHVKNVFERLTGTRTIAPSIMHNPGRNHKDFWFTKGKERVVFNNQSFHDLVSGHKGLSQELEDLAANKAMNRASFLANSPLIQAAQRTASIHHRPGEEAQTSLFSAGIGEHLKFNEKARTTMHRTVSPNHVAAEFQEMNKDFWSNFWGVSKKMHEAEATKSHKRVVDWFKHDQARLRKQRLNGGLAFAGGGSVPGEGNSDSVHALLTPGEFVMNRDAVSAVGVHNMQKINRFADGGAVNLLGVSSDNGGRGVSLSPAPSGRSDGQAGAVAAFGEKSASLAAALLSFVTKTAALQAALSAFPHTLTVQATHQVNVVVNGQEAFVKMMPSIKELVTQQIDGSIRKLLKEKLPELS